MLQSPGQGAAGTSPCECPKLGRQQVDSSKVISIVLLLQALLSTDTADEEAPSAANMQVLENLDAQCRVVMGAMFPSGGLAGKVRLQAGRLPPGR